MWRSGVTKRRVLYLALACVVLLGLYWLKTLADINLFRQFSLHNYFPFSLFQHEKVIVQRRGPVKIEEGFESLLPIPTSWNTLRTDRRDKVEATYELAADSGSRHLVVTSRDKEWWNIKHRYLLRVEPGDKFMLAGTLWSQSAGGSAEVQVSSFDAEGDLLERDMCSVKADGDSQFQRVENVCVVGPGVSLIRLRISGIGKGQFKFDDLSLVSLGLLGSE